MRDGKLKVLIKCKYFRLMFLMFHTTVRNFVAVFMSLALQFLFPLVFIHFGQSVLL